ncbi:MAG: entericidin A/B family lipoprotein [Neisseriaceae bacterium]|nr:entericidin A/B family lipoprotein [Neisseriaceae bacterium]MBQ9183454.1 entericidin A/B family lipoprotein [Neisseriaceae bacterium]MBQ9260229.1 entericidin A/B family lipoprotein [Neisseriaceae bacterium]MBQ9725364.1 entericidin A/B family lipoprotein [Neisseriaceae bacterium]MBR2251941.1 entericidin A/B family lipoprotein [Neisseriaceae bacterium]
MKKYALIVAALFALTACNTIAGVGQDVKSGGQAVTNAAHSVQRAM